MTVGDFVLVNTYMMQLYTPLNWLGILSAQHRVLFLWLFFNVWHCVQVPATV
jgi:ABC-type transport system involved in Fe-S cluster assembly fused permease/ATPase subunit